MDKDELDIYLELIKEAEAAGDFKTADKIDGMIKTSAFEFNNLPPWLRTWLGSTRNPATRARAIELIQEGVHLRGRTNFFNNLGFRGRLRRLRSTPADELTHENASKAFRGDAGLFGSAKSKLKNLLFTRGATNYETLTTRFREEVNQIMNGPRGLTALIDGEVARLGALPANAGRTADELRQMALTTPRVSGALRRLTTPMAELLKSTQAELRDKINEAINILRSDPRVRAELGLTGPYRIADLTMDNIGRVIAARYPKLLGPNSEISDDMFVRFFNTGRVGSRGFTGGAIDPRHFYTKQGAQKLLPPGYMFIIPALLGGMVIRPIIDPPGPKPGPDVVPPVGGDVVKETNELEADRKRAGQFRTPIPQLQAYILGKTFKGVFHQGKTTKKELYNMAIQEKGEAFANDLIQYAIKTYGLKGVGLGETDSPIGS